MLDGAIADSASVERWLSRFDPMRSDGFFSELATNEDSTYQISFWISGDGARTLRIVPQDGDFGVRLEGDESVYRLRSVRFDQFVPDRSLFTAQ